MARTSSRRTPRPANSGRSRRASRRAQQTVAAGFKAIKLRFHSPDWRDDVRTLDAVRKAVGDQIDIMVDGNWGWRIAPDRQLNRWDLKTAINVVEGAARSTASTGSKNRSTPTTTTASPNCARHTTTLRIAGGELNRGPEEIKTYLEKGCFDVYQPDCTMIGGISDHPQDRGDGRGRRARSSRRTPGRTASAWSRTCTAPRPSSRVPYIEFPYDPPNWLPEHRDFIFAEPLQIDGEGYVHLPQGPGLGIELDDEKLKKYEQGDTRRLI